MWYEMAINLSEIEHRRMWLDMKKILTCTSIAVLLLQPVTAAANTQGHEALVMDCWVAPNSCSSEVTKFISEWDGDEIGLETELGLFAVQIVDELGESPQKRVNRDPMIGIYEALQRLANWFESRQKLAQAARIVELSEQFERRRGLVPSAN